MQQNFQQKCFTAIHKHYSVDDWMEFADKNPSTLDFVAASSGTSDNDFNKLQQILNQIPAVSKICT